MRFVHAAAVAKPAMVTLKKGTYHWCHCGQTQSPPFCDGSHEGSSITPLEFEANGKTPMLICMCGLSKNAPYCDGSHRDY